MDTKAYLISLFIVFAEAALPIDYATRAEPACGPTAAECRLHNGTVNAIIRLRQARPRGPVRITGEVTGLSPGLHGFHVHEYGDLSEGCSSAGGHFNPFQRQHGAPNDVNKHVGDLGNIEADGSGRAYVNMPNTDLTFCGSLSVMGRAIVIHGGEDDLGRGGNEGSLNSGNSGPRVGCCVIGRAASQ